jgi:hypothetical protein
VSGVDLDRARAAKARLAARLAADPRVTGVGIARAEGGHVVRVLLVVPADDVPAEVDGVPVSTQVVGEIRACGGDH